MIASKHVPLNMQAETKELEYVILISSPNRECTTTTTTATTKIAITTTSIANLVKIWHSFRKWKTF